MTSASTTQVTIVGAGISGLLISRHLIDQGASVTLVGPEDRREQTLCTWRNVQAPDYYDEHILGRWRSWQFGANNMTIVHQSDEYWYEALNGLSFKTSLEDYLSAQPKLTRIKELADTKKQSNSLFQIDTASSSFTSPNLLDSRPPQIGEKTLIQQFYGVTIQTEKGADIVKRPILMDFSVSLENQQGVVFIYVIPFPRESILVEATFFGTLQLEESVLKNLAQHWINEHCNTDYVHDSPIFEEKGIIPMGPVSFIHNGNPAGIAAGSARQSSGYALQGLERQIKKYQELNDLTALSCSPYSSLSKWMDKLFLKVIQYNPALGKDIFSTMAKSLTGDEFAAFMADDFSIKDSFKIIRSLPKTPFLKAMISR